MDNLKFNEKLSLGKDVYIRDEIKKISLHILPDQERTTFVKRKKKEYKVPYSNKTVFEVILSGEEILEEEYLKT